MMTQTLSVTEAARRFSDVVNRVYYQGYSYVLTRGGVVVAKLSKPEQRITAAELARKWEVLPRLSPEDAEVWENEFNELKRTEPKPGVGVWDF